MPLGLARFLVFFSSAAVLVVCAALLVALGVYPQILDLTASYFQSAAVASMP